MLEGFHAVKHALRFGAEISELVATDPADLLSLADRLAPDIRPALSVRTEAVGSEELGRIARRRPAGGVVGIATRPRNDLDAVAGRPGRLIALENPRRMDNVGACIRVAAAASAAAVIVTGNSDPWHPDAIRGSAGLHFALPVIAAPSLPDLQRPIVAMDPSGSIATPDAFPASCTLAFGTERHGLSEATLGRAERIVRLPMRDGVSSLNLATAVAATIYRLS